MNLANYKLTRQALALTLNELEVKKARVKGRDFEVMKAEIPQIEVRVKALRWVLKHKKMYQPLISLHAEWVG